MQRSIFPNRDATREDCLREEGREGVLVFIVNLPTAVFTNDNNPPLPLLLVAATIHES